ncbi:uncharacterized protein LOC125314161 [Rhodamnia argentea]|uniref:Uncharacterized protein LOC115728413 n=1 Tax=Rhodamnia argentea TaxID=178133 RepID=A0A8B8MWX5_9MYRT|nr:uncharacterized protein LOC115728413 [Rhodamnia argentea]XP_048131608.1 uncharacterized protein LOC125314161 [Rhodamnia argentea]
MPDVSPIEGKAVLQERRGGGSAVDGSREVIAITDSEDDSDEVISVSGSAEEEEESRDHKPPMAQSDSDEEESTDFESDESVGGHGRCGREEFLSNACSEDDSIRSGEEKVFGERNRTPSVTEDGSKANISLDYLSSSSESSTEADDIGDEYLVAKGSESLSTDGDTSSSSEEDVSGSELEKITEIRKKIKRKDIGELSPLCSARTTTKELDIECSDDLVINNARKKEDEECRVSLVNEWLQHDVEKQKEEEAINVEHDIECMDDLVIDEAGRKENVESRVSWVKERLQGDVEEVKEEEAINVERSNAKIDCPSIDGATGGKRKF